MRIPTNKNRKPLQDLIPLSRPLRVLIDPSSACNFKCKFCVHGMEKKPFGSIMTLDTFYKTVDRLLEFEEKPNIIHLFGVGEPLLNKNIAKFAEILKEKNVSQEVALTTNGSLLTYSLSEKLVDSKIDRITISLNGLSDYQFKNNCDVHINYNELKEQIHYLCSIRKNTHVHIKIIGDYYTEIEKEKFINDYKNVCDSVNIDYLNNSWPGHDTSGGIGHDMYTGVKIEKNLVCPHVFYEMMINSDGSISPCSLDYKYSVENLGNVFDNSLVEIWDGKILTQLRNETIEGCGMKSYSICRECHYPTSCISVDITPYREDIKKKLEMRMD